ncbi:MAG: His/Gly/Thr/Pro-type tRNA ligase C-terminal domain-containing protein, partial [Brachybacterium sp.]|nr:His/Gly/Thr/Pro-type tRNA ligase C-terminal domain-containing protein [Brachybacterium sp.]
PMGADAKRRMAVVVDRLRRAGVSADMYYGDRGLKGAMKGADRAGALFALVLGDNELRDGTVVLRDLSTRQQTEVAVEDVEQVVTRALAEVTA